MGLRVASLFMLWLALSYASEIKKGRARSHGHYVCSTWGNNHFKTFDGDVYQFPGLCEYNFASDCRESYKEFSVQIQRALNSNNHPVIQYILITIKDFTVYLTSKLAVVDGQIVKTPYYSSGMFIENNDIYTKVYAKLGLILIWNQEDALMVELDSKFNNHTCGLCGDYNGIPIYNEFISEVASYNSITYGNLQRINKPNANCEDPDETQALPSCNEHRDECEKLLTSSAFADCHSRLNVEMYVQACMQDKCACNGNEDSFCLCSTISEYSRQCSHAGGRPGEWRTQHFCPKTCPGNMIYRESSSPCINTCSHLEISSLCEEHYMDGCFCPEGTVYDDITEKGCVPVSQCYCKLHGKGYSPGQSITSECEECTCDSGRWTCKDLPCPGACSVEGGSHITTFDGKKYTFHGDCYYVLAKGTASDSYVLLAELTPCGFTDWQTCLKTVVLLTDHRKNVVVFRSDGSVLLNEMTVNVPHVSASFSVFKPSSYYLIVQTSFGLRLQIQLFPVMQLFATADPSAKENLEGLCGNFNGIEGDDFQTASGLVEATGSAFANTWKAQSTCTDKIERLEDPCSLSIESANYAEHWCSLLKKSEGPFARCHLVIDPSEYYKKCKYDTCLCKDSEECLCAALSSYSRACAFKGIILGGWRQTVCTKEVSACPENQIFLYNLTMCQQTCRSVADGEKHCLQDFIPVDGCGCPDNTYLDNQDTCVPISKCPCYFRGSYLEPGDYVTKDDERCVCRNAKLQCTSVTLRRATECPPHKTYFDCNTFQNWTSQTPIQLSCHTPRTDHFQAECVSGCVCPQGLFDDGKGGCVEEKDCPCIHNNQWYSHGDEITVDCKTCTCQKGDWSCTKGGVCYGTCTIYGSGHYITFDGKFYDFDGSCEYVATQDFCGDKNSSSSFSVITENVPCGTTGVTCSKAIKMFLGNTELKLENKDYKEIQRDIGDEVHYRKRTVGLYLVIEASNGVMLIWDKKTTIFIKLTTDYQGKVCGLCGNFDGKSNNDFTTRSGLQETSALEFGNSWKQSYTCPDVTEEILPCNVKPHRKSWAEKECYLIRSAVFEICHSKVDPTPFYEACVHDACSCDSGGDCECFCSAVAAYAQECIKAKACVFWRTPDICPIFCDYYNPRDECEWHYEPCGSDIMTCKMINNVSTNFSVPYLEGCYPRCPPEKPIYNEETKKCETRDDCGCYFNGTYYEPEEEIPVEENCTRCVCVSSGVTNCTTIPGCPCVINGTRYEVGDPVGQIQEGDMCITYVCGENGSIIVGSIVPCPTTPSPVSSTSFSTPSTVSSTSFITTRSTPGTTTPCFELICNWTQWYDVSRPNEGDGDYETYDAIRNKHGNEICEVPEEIECRAENRPDMSLEELGQKVECNVTYGLICKNEEQSDATPICYNYEIRVYCCEWHEVPCETKPGSTPVHSTTTSTTIVVDTTTWQPAVTTTTPQPTPTTISKPTPPSTTPVTPTTTVSCDCIWTDWIDVSYPTVGAGGGEDESYENIQKHDPSWVCVKAENISCRAKDFPHVPIEDLGQKVECDVDKGLTCKNKDQVAGAVIPFCLNYEISVCCVPDRPECIPSTTTGSTVPPHVPTTTPTPTPSETPTSTTPYSTTSTTIWQTTTTIPGTPTPTPTTITSTRSPSPTPTTSLTPPPTTTAVSCDCIWTDWIDVSYPTVGAGGGEDESYENIQKHDPSWVCVKAENISCRAKDFPHVPIEDLGQKVECDVDKGLTCKNKDQVAGAVIPFCLNYEISVCCVPDRPECIPSTTTGSTVPPHVPTTTPTPTPSETPTSTTPYSTTSTTIWQTTTTIPGTPTPTPTTITSTRSPSPTPTTSLTPPPTTTAVSCDCIWTDWIDVSYPTVGAGGGEDESYENIQKHDPSWVCVKAENISCRAKDFPHVPIEDLGQKVECDVDKGLTCKNKDQVAGAVIPFCLNYEISVCCVPDRPECIPSTTTGSTVPPHVPTTTPTPTPSETPTSTTPYSATSTTTTTIPGTPTPTPTTIIGTPSPSTSTLTTTTKPPEIITRTPQPPSTLPIEKLTTTTKAPTHTTTPITPTATSLPTTTTTEITSTVYTKKTTTIQPGSTSPASVTTSAITETGSTPEVTPPGSTSSGTTSPRTPIVTGTSSPLTTTTTGTPPPGSASTSTSTVTPSQTSSPVSPTTSHTPGSTSPASVTTSAITETGSTPEVTPPGSTSSGTTSPRTPIVTGTSSPLTTTTTGTPPPGSASTSTSTVTPSQTSSPVSPTTSRTPGSTSPASVTTSAITETGSTPEVTPPGSTSSGTTSPRTPIVTGTSSPLTTTTTGTPPPGSASTSTSTVTPSQTSSPVSPTTSRTPGSTSPASVTTSAITETGSTPEVTPPGSTSSGTTSPRTPIVTGTSSPLTTTTTGTPPPGSASTSTSTVTPSQTSSPVSPTTSRTPGSTSPASVTTSAITETGSTPEVTPPGSTSSGTTSPRTPIVTGTSSPLTTTTTGTPPPGSASTSTSTVTPSQTSSPVSPTTSRTPGSTSPASVTTSAITETGSTPEVTPPGSTSSGTTSPRTPIVTGTSSPLTTTTTGTPPPGSASTSTSTVTPSQTSSPVSPTTSRTPGSTSPASVTTSAITETGSTPEVTPPGSTSSGTTSPRTPIVTGTSSPLTTTTTGTPPPGSASTSTSTVTPSQTSSPVSPTTSRTPGSTSPASVTTSAITETGSTPEVTPPGSTSSGTTSPRTPIVTGTSSPLTTTTTGTPPPGSASTSTSTVTPSQTSSPVSPTTSRTPGSTSPASVTTSAITETGSTPKVTTSASPLTSIKTTPVFTMTSGTIETTSTGTFSGPTVPFSTSASFTTHSETTSVESTSSLVTSFPVSATTSGTTPTESFTTTSGTTTTSSTATPVTTTTSSEIVSLVSTSTSGPTTVSSTGTISGTSTYKTVTTVSSTSAVPPTTPGKNCTISPNQTIPSGDSWWPCNCTEAKCVEDNIFVLIPVICNPPPKPSCTNGLAPVPVLDKDGCCWHWECDCYCTGWGDPHYITFDGQYYSYQGNCTYVLVEEINKSVDNFGIYIDNYHCNAQDAVSCPRTLIVRHETQEVRIATVRPNSFKVEVTVNKQAVALPYKKFGLTVYESGINHVVEIPELKVNVTYNGLSFSIRMPYSSFGNNTQGQCGTCTNNTADDCMLPNGNIAENCETMADHWQVVDPSKPQCSPGLIPTKGPSTTTGQPCKESSICQLLLGSVFEKCHKLVYPEKYYAACVFDSCTLPQLDLECSSLQIYAATCADQGVCIDWRSHTNGVCCKYFCPAYKEYRACGPIKEMTCKSSPEQQNQNETKAVEGCFCPNGTMLYDSGVDVCVKTCGCVGLDNKPREYGEKFTVDCKDCICLEGGNGIVCEAHKCAEQNKTSCDGEGLYKVTEVNSEDPCCPIITCKCNTSLCTTKPPKCKLGFEVYSHIPSGQCCPVYQCVSKRVCVHENAEFLPNSSVFVDKCQNCFCTNEVNITTQLNVISCEHVPCDTYCEPGYERQPVKGECCGKCVQTKCVIHTQQSSVLILSPGEFKNDPYNNCTVYSCVNIHNQLISSTSEITCPAFNEETCKPGTVTLLPNGCCKTCAPLDSPTPCSVRQRKDFIVYQGCHSLTRVDLTECEGTCGTFSLYSAEANSLEHSCSCCREAKTSVRAVELKCPTGHSITHKYVYVESCSCQETECDISKSKESTSSEENDKERALSRIKRAISLTSK
nr:PREDICTED: mucin-2-like [Apteryx mantelli mantelli]